MNTTIKIVIIFFSVTLTCGVIGFIISKANPHSPYEAIFNFGDSISDTGNAQFVSNLTLDSSNPYGSSYFKHPAGRFSDGRLIIDFIGIHFSKH